MESKKEGINELIYQTNRVTDAENKQIYQGIGGKV